MKKLTNWSDLPGRTITRVVDDEKVETKYLGLRYVYPLTIYFEDSYVEVRNASSGLSVLVYFHDRKEPRQHLNDWSQIIGKKVVQVQVTYRERYSPFGEAVYYPVTVTLDDGFKFDIEAEDTAPLYLEELPPS